jgi:hypothetical protein
LDVISVGSRFTLTRSMRCGARRLHLASHSVPRSRSTSWKCGLRLHQVDSDFDWNTPTNSPTSRRHPARSRTRVILAIVLGIGGPCAIYEIRGLCWEGLLGSIVAFAIALTVLRLPLSMWIAVVLVVGGFGSLGLIGWSGWRFQNLNVFSSYSPRLTICGRDYQPDGAVLTRLPAIFENYPTHDVMGVTPSGSAILGVGCQTTVLYIESRGPTYQPYALLGGP